MNEDDGLRRLRVELEEMGLDDLPPEVMGEIERARLTGGRVRVPRFALDRSDLNAASRRVSVTRSTVNGQSRTEIRETGADGVERVYRSLEEAPAELRAWIERFGPADAPGGPASFALGDAGPVRGEPRRASGFPVEPVFPGAVEHGGSGLKIFLLTVIALALVGILGVLVWMAVR